MTFKEQLRADIANTFFNEDEFADWHDVDGKRMLIILIEDDLERRDKAMETLSRITLFHSIELPIYKNQVTILVPEAVFGPRLRVDAEILLDRKRQLRIMEFTSDAGVYCIVASEVK